MPPIEFQGVKLHRFPRGFLDHEPPSLTLGCKWLPNTPAGPTSFDLKSFIKPESGPRILGCPKRESPQAEAQPGGTRWNPTQEQIGILEMLYRSGMRTPNAQQIEQITAQLSQYGKIEGKNVFYWFQNHKARERQKQKRNSLGLVHIPRTTASPLVTTRLLLSPASGVEEEISDGAPCKRKCKSWGVDRGLDEANENRTSDEEEEEVGNRTLKLFPLHPQGRC